MSSKLSVLPSPLLPSVPQGSTPKGRRRFLRALVGTGAATGAMVLLPKTAAATGHASLRPRLDVVKVSSVEAGSIVDFSYPTDRNTAFLTKLSTAALGGVGPDKDIVAFLRACPHMGCEIFELQIDKAVLGPCGCHRSRFDLSQAGRQIIGRASQNLVQVTLEVEEEMIVATGLIGLPYGDALVEE